jgi:hypothetical protein
MDWEMIMILSRVCALCEEEGHAIIGSPFVPFHIKGSIARHVELQNMARALMDHPLKQESRIPII